MLILSVKHLRFYITAALFSLLIVFSLMLILRNAPGKQVGAVTCTEASAPDILRSYLYSFGWETDPVPIEVSEITVPRQFGEVWAAYNRIQLAQGCDLTKYKEKRVKKYVYRIVNYPGAVTDGSIRATVLVYKDTVIGGDVSSVRLNGFMHGFRYPSEDHGPDQTG